MSGQGWTRTRPSIYSNVVDGLSGLDPLFGIEQHPRGLRALVIGLLPRRVDLPGERLKG
jgi:hypothetical protein